MADITTAARALVPVKPDERLRVAQAFITGADAARRYQDRLGRGHPSWGNGTLASMAKTRPLAQEPCPDDPEFLECLMVMLGALRDWKRYARPEAQDTHNRLDGSSSSRFGAMSSPHSSQKPNVPVFIRSAACRSA